MMKPPRNCRAHSRPRRTLASIPGLLRLAVAFSVPLASCDAADSGGGSSASAAQGGLPAVSFPTGGEASTAGGVVGSGSAGTAALGGTSQSLAGHNGAGDGQGGTAPATAGSAAVAGSAMMGGATSLGGAASAATGGVGIGGDAGTATCNPSDALARPSAVNIAKKGAAFTGPHEVAVETDPGLPGATVFRPKDLQAGAKYPILAWGQGGCSLNGLTNPEFNAELASHGYLMLADGTPNGADSRPLQNDYKAMGAPLIKYIEWAIKENARPCSQYYQALDTTKLAVFGWSCGGLMTEGAASDPRLTTFMLNSSGMLAYDQKIIDGMHTPALVILGGSSDSAYANGTNDYAKMSKIPAVLASINVGHGGTYQEDNGGSFAKVDLAWLNWWLKGDLGPTGKGMFVGPNCGLCSNAAWTLNSKNLP